MKVIKSSLSVERKTLLTHTEITESVNTLSDWKRKSWLQFSIKMRDADFPCLFSKSAWNAKSIKFIFCDRHEEHNYTDFLNGMVQYSEYIKITPLKKRVFSPLVVFFSPDFYKNKTQHEVGWEALKWVHLHDTYPWPSDIPYEPESAAWTFCFNEIQYFINMSSKDHSILRNRNLGAQLTFVINARENFDAVANGKTKSGRQIREQIRLRVINYNGGVFPSELGFYGEGESLEWKQYQLSERHLVRPLQCPFKNKK